uniref:Zgc:92429 n=1 Tax=Neogobius melanostomus TaxID=47308 RepID=A0A8C6TKN7_9GOBI
MIGVFHLPLVSLTRKPQFQLGCHRVGGATHTNGITKKKKVACRHDWHQTGNNVVVTIYAKNAHPEFSTIEANGTILFCQIQFENDKIFKREFHLWGGINYVPSKVEIVLRKADPVSWGKLEDPNYKPEPEKRDEEEKARQREQDAKEGYDDDMPDLED